MHKTDLKCLIALAVIIGAPASFVYASATGPKTCKHEVELQFSGRYGIYDVCFDRFGARSEKFTGRYADRFVDPVTGEVF